MVPVQHELIPEFPPVVGNKDFALRRARLERVNELLLASGLEREFVASFPQKQRNTSKRVSRLVLALRCTILRMLFGLPYRRMAADLASNHLFQRFCGLIRLDSIRIPSATRLEAYEKLVSAEFLIRLSSHLNRVAGGLTVSDGDDAFLERPLSLGVEYVDATALKARVHYPIDWLLLRDATRTLVLAIQQVRKRDIVNRMPKKPMAYLSAMNKLCIQMTHARRTKEAKRTRKSTLRKMKALLRTVEGHARGHLAKLHKHGASKGLKASTIAMLDRKLVAILDQVEPIIRQAHERIIGERRVKNEDKILSLYEHDMHVIVRGKAGAEVEFGNTLFLAEQAEGLIVDWCLYQDKSPGDAKMIPGHLERMEKDHGISLEGITGDRGFDSAANTALLKDKARNNLCPRNLQTLEARLQEKGFKQDQTRRAQTEARIAIVTRCFTGNPAYKWGHTNKERLCAWAVLAHNLWVLARLPRRAGELAKVA